MLVRYRSALLLVLALAAAALGIACGVVGTPGAPAEPSTPLTVRVIHGVPISTLIAQMYEVREKPGLLRNYGREYVIENRRIDASSEVANVMAAGEGDVGFTALGATINANERLNARLRIVADVVQGGVDGHEGLWFAVRDDGPRTVQELRGRTVATLGFGTFADLAMRVGLKKNGLDPEKDVTAVQVPFPAMEANLRERKVDMIQLVQPFYNIAMPKGGIRVLYTATEALGRTQTLFLVMREDFGKQNPRRVQAFFDDYYRFNQWALDPANRAEVIAIGARMMDVPPASLQYFGSKQDWFRARDGLPNVEAMKNDLRVLREFGIVQSNPNLDPWIDLSWIRKAAENARR